jgi:recombination protein RecR
MPAYPPTFERLIELLKGLPGIGRRTSERLAFALLKWPPDRLAALADTLHAAATQLSPCPECANLSEGGEPCSICRDTRRDHAVICVVEDTVQLHSIENSGQYRGVYHVLGGHLAPLDGKGPESLNIPSLLARIADGDVQELIVALSSDVEGQATTIYLTELLAGKNLAITRLARGLPAGADLSYADAATVSAALSGRTAVR